MTVGQGSTVRSERLNIRAGHGDKELLEQAARIARMSTSRFVLEAALRSAEEVIADQTRFTVPPERWEAFVELLDRPARIAPGLAEAAQRPSPFRGE
ncbi:MAG: DUF1778 domain-containing protein [Actinobacteria bacterium]|nr:DUF1778 domain-containing protein [Actinomycetota bacterium]